MLCNIKLEMKKNTWKKSLLLPITSSMKMHQQQQFHDHSVLFFGCFENSASDKQKRKRILMFDSYARNAQKVPFEFTDWISLKIFNRSCSQLRKMWFHSTIFYIMWKNQNFLCTLIFLSEGVRINVGRFYQNQLRAF